MQRQSSESAHHTSHESALTAVSSYLRRRLCDFASVQVFGPPVGTQQMTALLIDVFRSAVRDHSRPPVPTANPLTADGVWSGSAPIMMYTMLHLPGNTPRSWRRQLFSDVMHGMKFLNLFNLLDEDTAPGPDFVGLTAGGASHYVEARRTLNELGNLDDIVMHGAAQSVGSPVALLMSETGDIYHVIEPQFAMSRQFCSIFSSLRVFRTAGARPARPNAASSSR